MDQKMYSLVHNLEKEHPASISKITEVERIIDKRLPEQYKDYLLISNGGEGFVGESYLALWSVEELIPLNKGYCVDEFAPGLFFFGSDGGGEAYAFDFRSDECPVVNVPFIGMSTEIPKIIGKTFIEFLEYLNKS